MSQSALVANYWPINVVGWELFKIVLNRKKDVPYMILKLNNKSRSRDHGGFSIMSDAQRCGSASEVLFLSFQK